MRVYLSRSWETPHTLGRSIFHVPHFRGRCLGRTLRYADHGARDLPYAAQLNQCTSMIRTQDQYDFVAFVPRLESFLSG